MITSDEHAITAQQKARAAGLEAEDYGHKADRATSTAIVGLIHAVLALRQTLVEQAAKGQNPK